MSLGAIRERVLFLQCASVAGELRGPWRRAERRFVRWQVFVCFEHVVSSVCKGARRESLSIGARTPRNY